MLGQKEIYGLRAASANRFHKAYVISGSFSSRMKRLTRLQSTLISVTFACLLKLGPKNLEQSFKHVGASPLVKRSENHHHFGYFAVFHEQLH